MTDTTEKYTPPQKPSPPPTPAKKKRRRGFRSCILGVLLGLLGLMAGRLGNLWSAFDVFSQFSMQFIMIAAAFTIGFFMPRLKTLSAITLLVLMVAGYGMWPHYLNTSAQTIDSIMPGERQLKVASFNTWKDNADQAALTAEILRIDADVMTLIEFGPNKAAMLDALRAKYPHQYACHANVHCNLAIISRFPISGMEAQAPWAGPPYIFARLGSEFSNLAIFGVHTTRFPHSRAQLAQINALAERIEQESGPLLIMGDFNATPFSRITKSLVQRLGLVRHTNLPTWPANFDFPQLAIDHIFTSATVRSLASPRNGEAAGSDHFPVIMTVAIPAP